jgi:hypothetical protein
MSFNELSKTVAELHQKLVDINHELTPKEVDVASKEYWQNATPDFHKLNIERVELIAKKMQNGASLEADPRYSEIMQKLGEYIANNPYNIWRAERQKRADAAVAQLTKAQQSLNDYLKHPVP